MKTIKYITIMLILLFSNVICVYAACTKGDISDLRSDAQKIRITYKHNGVIESEDITIYNQFTVTIKNIIDDLYISLLAGTVTLDNVNTTTQLSTGKWIFKIYSRKCNVLIDEIDVYLPKFNLYSIDPLCDGIDGDDFELCGKYYGGNVSYSEFESSVNEYRKIMNEKNNDNKDNTIDFNKLVHIAINYIIVYNYYIASGLAFLLILLIVIIVNKKKKKRGVLE